MNCIDYEQNLGFKPIVLFSLMIGFGLSTKSLDSSNSSTTGLPNIQSSLSGFVTLPMSSMAVSLTLPNPVNYFSWSISHIFFSNIVSYLTSLSCYTILAISIYSGVGTGTSMIASSGSSSRSRSQFTSYFFLVDFFHCQLVLLFSLPCFLNFTVLALGLGLGSSNFSGMSQSGQLIQEYEANQSSPLLTFKAHSFGNVCTLQGMSLVYSPFTYTFEQIQKDLRQKLLSLELLPNTPSSSRRLKPPK